MVLNILAIGCNTNFLLYNLKSSPQLYNNYSNKEPKKGILVQTIHRRQ